MKVRALSLVAVLLVLPTAGCALTATIVPVEGPLSELQPVPVIHATIGGVATGRGTISFAMPDGETCQGEWGVDAGQITGGTTGLLAEYGPMYLDGYTGTGAQDVIPGQALALCSKGRSVQLEFIRVPDGMAHVFGVGKDSRGNIYRVAF
jgi:hypothetical protein